MDMRYAIIYYSNCGQTKKIAHYMRECIIQENGISDVVRMVDVEDHVANEEFLTGIDHILIGAPVYNGRFPRKLISWIDKNRNQISTHSVSVFTVSLNAADPSFKARKVDDELIKLLVRLLNLRPTFVASLAGALSYTKYGFFKKFIMRRISESAGGPTDTNRDHEMTNWAEVAAFIKSIYFSDTSSEHYFYNRFLITDSLARDFAQNRRPDSQSAHYQ